MGVSGGSSGRLARVVRSQLEAQPVTAAFIPLVKTSPTAELNIHRAWEVQSINYKDREQRPMSNKPPGR